MNGSACPLCSKQRSPPPEQHRHQQHEHRRNAAALPRPASLPPPTPWRQLPLRLRLLRRRRLLRPRGWRRCLWRRCFASGFLLLGRLWRTAYFRLRCALTTTVRTSDSLERQMQADLRRRAAHHSGAHGGGRLSHEPCRRRLRLRLKLTSPRVLLLAPVLLEACARLAVVLLSDQPQQRTVTVPGTALGRRRAGVTLPRLPRLQLAPAISEHSARVRHAGSRDEMAGAKGRTRA